MFKKLITPFFLSVMLIVLLISPVRTATSQISFGNIFLKFFPQWRAEIDKRYNTTNHYAYMTPYNLTINPSEGDYYIERFASGFDPLIRILAYNLTGNVTYLDEAQNKMNDYMENAFNPATGAFDLYLIGGDEPCLTDIPVNIAKDQLNRLNSQTYNVTKFAENLTAKAKVNNATDMAWSYAWDNPELQFGGLNRFTAFAWFYAYLTYQGVGNYSSYIPKIFHMLERSLNGTIYSYGIEDPWKNRSPFYHMLSLIHFFLSESYYPILNKATLQTRLNDVEVALRTDWGYGYGLNLVSQTALSLGISGAGLSRPSRYLNLTQWFFNDYNLTIGTYPEEFGCYWTWTRFHMWTSAQVLTVLGLFPDTVLTWGSSSGVPPSGAVGDGTFDPQAIMGVLIAFACISLLTAFVKGRS